jgi:hypothetical protein
MGGRWNARTYRREELRKKWKIISIMEVHCDFCDVHNASPWLWLSTVKSRVSDVQPL